MSLPLFPLTYPYTAGGMRGLGFTVMKSAKFSTSVATASNAYTVRVQNYANPIWEWTLVFNYLKDIPTDVPVLYAPYTDYKIMQGFYLSVSGQDGTFLYLDANDNYVGPSLI